MTNYAIHMKWIAISLMENVNQSEGTVCGFVLSDTRGLKGIISFERKAVAYRAVRTRAIE